MLRAERSQEVACVEGLAGSHHTTRLWPAEETHRGLHHQGCSDRVDVAPSRNGTTLRAS